MSRQDGIIQMMDGETPVYPRTKAEAVFFDGNYEKKLNAIGIINLNVLNNKADAYESASAARQALPSSLRNKGVCFTYLYGTSWCTEQYIGDSWNQYIETNFRTVVMSDDVDFLVAGVAPKKMVKELYLTGITESNLSEYQCLVFQHNSYNVWGINIRKISTSVVVAKGVIRQSEQPSDGIYPLVEAGSSGISGYVCYNFSEVELNGAAVISPRSLHLENSPEIYAYINDQALSESISNLEAKTNIANCGIFNVNLYNNKADAYVSYTAARSAIPASMQKLGLIFAYLLSDGWKVEQYVGDGQAFNVYYDQQFVRLLDSTNCDCRYFVSLSPNLLPIIKELYVEGIQDVSQYRVRIYQNTYGYYGVYIIDSNNNELAKKVYQNQGVPADGVYELEEVNSSGVSGYVYWHFSETPEVNTATYLVKNAIDLSKSPCIIKYILEKQIAALALQISALDAHVGELEDQLSESVQLTRDRYEDGYYLLGSAMYYSETGDYAIAVFDISEYIGKSGKITVTAHQFANQYLFLWGVVNSIAASQGYIAHGPTVNTTGTDTFDIPSGGKYLVVQCRRTDHVGEASVRIDYIPSVQKEIQELQEEVNISVELNLPDKIYAVVGDTLQLFYRGIIIAPNPYDFGIAVSCSKGVPYKRYFEYTPVVEDIGTTTFEISLFDKAGKMLGTASCDLVTVAAPSSPSSAKKILCFGDSLTSNGDWPAEACRRLIGSGGTPAGKGLSNIAFCGSMQKELAGYFGVGGWTWGSYIGPGEKNYRFYVSGVSSISLNAVYSNNGNNFTVIEVNITGSSGNILCRPANNTAPSSSGTLTKVSGSGDTTVTFNSAEEVSGNPLWDTVNNKMSFIPYANQVSNGQIDAVCVLLTWNGLSAFMKNFSSYMNSVKTFADTLHSEFPNAKMKLMGIQLPNQEDLHGYGAASAYSNKWGMSYTVFQMNKAYQELANDPNYSSFVEFVNVSSQFDSEYNMPMGTKAVNTRNAQTEVIGTNGVHPATEGYYQIGDVIYRNIVANFCQS